MTSMGLYIEIVGKDRHLGTPNQTQFLPATIKAPGKQLQIHSSQHPLSQNNCFDQKQISTQTIQLVQNSPFKHKNHSNQTKATTKSHQPAKPPVCPKSTQQTTQKLFFKPTAGVQPKTQRPI
jgi:hypothetical protein